MLFFAAAMAAPRVDVLPSADGTLYALKVRGGKIDAWTFAHHYDRDTKLGLKGFVWPRRGLFIAGLAGGVVMSLGAAAWSSNGVDIPQALLLTTGLTTFVLTIPVAIVQKRRTLDVSRHWTVEEAAMLAAERPISHGLNIVPTASGFAVVNRTGRPLGAAEIAGKLGDRGTLRRIRAQQLAVNGGALTSVVVGAGLIFGGMGMVKDEGERADYHWTGVGALAAGTTLVLTGAISRLAFRQRSPARYWTREELQTVIDL